MESRNFGPSKNLGGRKPESSPFKLKIPAFLKKAAVITATAVASMLLYEKHYGGTDYSSAGSFTEAFKKARENDENVFVWNGKKFTTDLIDKEFSDNYWESKKFLEEYYSTDYFKNKGVLSLSDSLNLEEDINEKIEENPRYKELRAKADVGLLEDPDEWDELFQYQEATLKRKFDTPEFSEKADSLRAIQKKERILNLNEPTRMYITHYKGDKHADGSYDPKTKEVYIYKPRNSTDEVTAVHELTHKSTRGNSLLIYNDSFYKLTEAAYNSAKNNQHFINKYGQAGFDYLSDPTEIDARQNSTRFWLYKHFKGYTPGTPFTSEHYVFLVTHQSELPYDITQLMELFPDRTTFISNMNTY